MYWWHQTNTILGTKQDTEKGLEQIKIEKENNRGGGGKTNRTGCAHE